MYSSTHQWGRRGIETYALSGIDIALWDLMGKLTDQPIHALFGSVHSVIQAYYAPDLKPADLIAEECEKAVESGFSAIKLRAGLGVEEDLAIVAKTRRVVGDDVVLMIDPNMAYDLKTAIRMAHAFNDYNLLWIEEPVRTHSLCEYVDSLRKVSEHIPYYVAGGESLFTRYEIAQLISRRAVDVVQPDCTTVGGITEARKIASMAEASGISFVPHVACSSIATIGLAAALHVIASSTAALYVEYDPYVSPLRREILDEPILPVGGVISIPEKPGLGIDLNWKAVEKYLNKG